MVAAVQGEVVGGSTTGKLIVPPVEAAQWVQTQIERGQTIRKQRLRYSEDLEQARARKSEWVTQTHDLLKGMFDNDAVAQEFMTWEARVLPDFAELHLFIEAFYDEMEQRLKKLQAIHRRIPVGRQSVHRPAVAAPPRTARESSDKPAAAEPKASSSDPTCILLTHGDCADAAARVDDLITRLGLNIARADFGPGSHESFDAATDVAFALVIAPSAAQFAAEPMALFHLGCCVGKVGSARVCVLSTDNAAAAPADLCGLPSLTLDPNDGWQLQLARQLKRAGVNLDLNRIC